MPTVYLNGELVPEERAMIPVVDRGFLYGDGLFETMCVCRGKPFRWDHHLARLEQGLRFLRIRLPGDTTALRAAAAALIRQNQASDAILRLTVSRGTGPRGYSPRGADTPTVVMSLHPAAASRQALQQWKLAVASLQLQAHAPLARLKTCNKLLQIMARAEADAAGADESLLENTSGHVVEGASSNLFWLRGNEVCTAPVDDTGILPGVTREVVLECARKLNLTVREQNIGRNDLAQMDAVFLSLSTVGIAEAIALDGATLRRSALVRDLFEAYWQIVESECGAG